MSQSVRTIVVGVASVDDTDPVLPPCVALARELGATLHVAHALDRPGEEPRERLEARVRALAGGVPTVCHVVEGAATDHLPELAQELGADLLVVGATRRSRIRRWFLGTTAEGVVRRATVPVLVQRGALAREARRVLLTTDLSGVSPGVHEQGVDLVEALAGERFPDLRTLLVVQDAAAALLPRAALERLAQQELDGFVRARRPRERAIQPKVRVGCVADEILAEAAEWRPELLVVGSHGRAGHRPLLGSVAGATLRGAACNVLVVPPGAGERPAGGEADAALPLVSVA
ncbi:MAG: universal stress protein [Gemmatimonadetes bacterium]|nr:universal stress protein [Gemmatimonadota bacterium]